MILETSRVIIVINYYLYVRKNSPIWTLCMYFRVLLHLMSSLFTCFLSYIPESLKLFQLARMEGGYMKLTSTSWDEVSPSGCEW
jgi:hypothetical protein